MKVFGLSSSNKFGVMVASLEVHQSLISDTMPFYEGILQFVNISVYLIEICLFNIPVYDLFILRIFSARFLL